MMPEVCISIRVVACFFLRTTAILSIRPHSLLCSVYGNPFVSPSPSHPLVSWSVGQSPVYCQTISPFIWPSVPSNKPIRLSLSLSSPSIGQPSVHPSVRQSSVHQSTSRPCCQCQSQGFQSIPLLLIPSAQVQHKQQ